MSEITIVSATRYNEKDFFEKAAIGRAFAQTYASLPVRLKIYFGNREPIPKCYNDAVAGIRDPGAIVVFTHDDVHIVDFFWIRKLVMGLEEFDILGVAGNRRRLPGQTSWAFVDERGTWDAPENLSGVVGHGKTFPCQLSAFGSSPQACKLLDGVFLATRKDILDRSGIRFDERFDFHFYDLDFCRQAEAKNLRIGTVPLSIIHESAGHFFTPAWQANRDKYLLKWKA
jgi:GT2 family glycosyltransferase